MAVLDVAENREVGLGRGSVLQPCETKGRSRVNYNVLSRGQIQFKGDKSLEVINWNWGERERNSGLVWRGWRVHLSLFHAPY